MFLVNRGSLDDTALEAVYKSYLPVHLPKAFGFTFLGTIATARTFRVAGDLAVLVDARQAQVLVRHMFLSRTLRACRGRVRLASSCRGLAQKVLRPVVVPKELRQPGDNQEVLGGPAINWYRPIWVVCQRVVGSLDIWQKQSTT